MTALLDDHLYDQITATSGATKYCSACAADHPVEAFAFKSKANLKLHSQCRAAKCEKARASYALDGASQRTANAARRAELTAYVNDMVDAWLIGKRCAFCGATTSLCAIGSTCTSLKRLRKAGWSIAEIEAELDEADVRCRRCGQAGHGRSPS